MTKYWKKYILWFDQEHVEFRQAEFYSIAKLFNLSYRILSENLLKPFWLIEFPNDHEALKFASRSVGLRCVLELWSHATNYTHFHESLRRFVKEQEDHAKQYLSKANSFKITVETYNKHISQTEKVQKIESLDYLQIEGPVDLNKPNTEWWHIEFWGLDPKNVPEQPEDILFGRWLANGQRDLIKELSLKQRKFIGNTSMDAQLSLLMANQALVKDGDFVLDPFVGTGSLLVSAAKFGGFVMGADIDYMMLHAKSRPSRIQQRVRDKDESIRANLRQYGCEQRYLDVIVSDFSNKLWRDSVQFDSIITDPPYGIRESTERIETKEASKHYARTEDMVHYPSTSHYNLQELFADLLNFAAKHLCLGGRLVCWMPFYKSDYSDELLPRHPCLELVANSEQPLSGYISRRLLTYEKHLEFTDCTQVGVEVLLSQAQNENFRARYFDSNIESRTERRLRKAAEREKGRLEAMKRGKKVTNLRDRKRNLNKARFDE